MEKKLNCVIVDDDPVSLAVVEELVERTAFLRLQKSFNDPVKALKWLSENHIDLLLLDIEMPELSGLDLLEALFYKPQVIIISSKQQYAVNAFDYDVTAYLLKPIDDFKQFLKAITRAKTRIEALNAQTPYSESIYIKVDSVFTHLAYEKILWVEAFGDYVKINTDKKVFLLYNTMKAIEETFPHRIFLRVHRSFIVNCNKIESIDQGQLTINGKMIPIGNSYRESLMKRIPML